MRGRHPYIISERPVHNTKTGELLGHAVRLSDGTSYFSQVKRVPRGQCVNYGPAWARIAGR